MVQRIKDLAPQENLNNRLLRKYSANTHEETQNITLASYPRSKISQCTLGHTSSLSIIPKPFCNSYTNLVISD